MVSVQTLRLAPRHAEIRRLAVAIEGFAARCGISMRAAHHITLAADELISNVVDHGRTPTNGRIVVVLRHEQDRLIMEITYRGLAFDPTAEAKAPSLDASIDDRPIGGLGVHFAKTLLDGLGYGRVRGRNRLTLTKILRTD